MMMREPGKWPGVTPLERDNPKSRLVHANEPALDDGKKVKVGLCPLLTVVRCLGFGA